MKPLVLLALPLFALSPARAADCGPRTVDQLLEAEQKRIDILKQHAHDKKGPTEAVDKDLDLDLAKAGPCMKEEDLAKFDRLREAHGLYCGWILSNSLGKSNIPAVHVNNCEDDWAWLKPYRDRQQANREKKRAQDRERADGEKKKWAAEMATFEGVFKHENERLSNLRYCSEYSKGVIMSGEAPDGVCAVDWSYLSPAEAKLGPGMSPKQLDDFARLKDEYDQVCRVLEGKVGADAKRISLCGADWTWLNKALLAMSLKAGEQKMLKILGNAP